MYTIIGGDGREYGPATAEQVRAWLAGGRANLDTQAKVLGTNEWKRLGDYPAFGGHGEEPPLAHAVPGAERTLAGRGARLAAAVIDGALSLLCLWPLMNPIFTDAASRNNYSFAFADAVNLSASPHAKLAAWAFVFLVVVQVLMLSTRGQSIGKRLCGIRIVRFRDERNPGFVHAFLLRGVLPGLIELIPVFGMIFMLVDTCFIFRADRRCLHDLMADTVVVSGAPGAGPETPRP